MKQCELWGVLCEYEPSPDKFRWLFIGDYATYIKRCIILYKWLLKYKVLTGGRYMCRPKIIIDIKFRDGTYIRGIVAHSIDFDPNRHWALKIYMNEDAVYIDNPKLYWGVDSIMVVGYLDKEEKI